jgi:hypothetical protein
MLITPVEISCSIVYITSSVSDLTESAYLRLGSHPWALLDSSGQIISFLKSQLTSLSNLFYRLEIVGQPRVLKLASTLTMGTQVGI